MPKVRLFGQVECPNCTGLILGQEMDKKGAIYGECLQCKKRWLITNWPMVDLVNEENIVPMGDEK
jgi:hypothetical protein